MQKRIRFKTWCNTALGGFKQGDIAFADESYARHFIEVGVAELVPDPPILKMNDESQPGQTEAEKVPAVKKAKR